MEMELESVVLVDDNGNEQEFMVLETFGIEDATYYVLLPPDEAEEAVILKLVVGEDGEESLVDIEDDEEWEKAEAVWNELLDEEFADAEGFTEEEDQ
jgi:uncharacterized protein YrzB (UPF0473 family)